MSLAFIIFFRVIINNILRTCNVAFFKYIRFFESLCLLSYYEHFPISTLILGRSSVRVQVEIVVQCSRDRQLKLSSPLVKRLLSSRREQVKIFLCAVSPTNPREFAPRDSKRSVAACKRDSFSVAPASFSSRANCDASSGGSRPTPRRYFRQRRHRHLSVTLCRSPAIKFLSFHSCRRVQRIDGPTCASRYSYTLTGREVHRFLLEFQAAVVELAQLLELAHHVAGLVRQQL